MTDAAFEAEALVKLEPKIRCVAMVGYFLQFWSVLESTVNRALEYALDLTSLQGTIVAKNIMMRDKIHILKTLVDLRGVDVERFKAVLEEISTLSGDRNMMAHDMFFPDDEGDGVQFLVVKAKGKLAFPKTHWSAAAFLKKYVRLSKLAKDAEDLATSLSTISLAKLLREAKDASGAPRGQRRSPAETIP